RRLQGPAHVQFQPNRVQGNIAFQLSALDQMKKSLVDSERPGRAASILRRKLGRLVALAAGQGLERHARPQEFIPHPPFVSGGTLPWFSVVLLDCCLKHYLQPTWK